MSSLKHAPSVQLSPKESDLGFTKITWTYAGKNERTLFQVIVGGKEVYQGKASATFVSGVPSGKHAIRVRALTSNGLGESKWSEAIYFEVTHQSFEVVLLMLSLGFIVFLSTVFTIFKGANCKGTKKEC